MKPAPGQWWRSHRGAIYLVRRLQAEGGFAEVVVACFHGSDRGRVFGVRFEAAEWAKIARKGVRMEGPPDVNHHGHDIRHLVAAELAQLETE